VVADGGFTNRESILQMQERKLDFIGSLGDPAEGSEAATKSKEIDPKFAPHFFILQSESNTLQCPAGKQLPYVGQSGKRGNHYRQIGLRRPTAGRVSIRSSVVREALKQGGRYRGCTAIRAQCRSFGRR
jgi:hypothetical protein